MDTELHLQSIERDRAAEAAQLQRIAHARAVGASDSSERPSSRHHIARAFASLRFRVFARPSPAPTSRRGRSDVRRPY